VGCAGDPGPVRVLGGAERLALGRPLDLNRATAVDLSGVPGLSLRLGEAVVADRESRGPFERVEDLVRVKGVGPARLARAQPFLECLGFASARRRAKPGSSPVAGTAAVE
jgi:competence protein ComEA